MNKSNTIFKLGEWIWLDQPQQMLHIESGELELYAVDNGDNADGIRTFLAEKKLAIA